MVIVAHSICFYKHTTVKKVQCQLAIVVAPFLRPQNGVIFLTRGSFRYNKAGAILFMIYEYQKGSLEVFSQGHCLFHNYFKSWSCMCLHLTQNHLLDKSKLRWSTQLEFGKRSKENQASWRCCSSELRCLFSGSFPGSFSYTIISSQEENFRRP